MRRFILYRKEDATGMSGTGAVASGVEFRNGIVALSWHSELPSVTTYTSASVMELLHSHDGEDDTEVVWLDKKHMTPKKMLEKKEEMD